ncbi:MAG: hypothetical protein JRM82_02460 [Nitrososphaerota archaeon]|nr:hypothetical protein [Nitrososphaerota archaeon]
MSAAQPGPQLDALLVTDLVDYSMGLEGAMAFPRFAWNGSTTLAEPGCGPLCARLAQG